MFFACVIPLNVARYYPLLHPVPQPLHETHHAAILLAYTCPQTCLALFITPSSPIPRPPTTFAHSKPHPPDNFFELSTSDPFTHPAILSILTFYPRRKKSSHRYPVYFPPPPPSPCNLSLLIMLVPPLKVFVVSLNAYSSTSTPLNRKAPPQLHNRHVLPSSSLKSGSYHLISRDSCQNLLSSCRRISLHLTSWKLLLSTPISAGT